LEDQVAAAGMGSFVLTVKAEYLFIATMYYANEGDILRVEKEILNFQR
jgi:hypothetical protein